MATSRRKTRLRSDVRQLRANTAKGAPAGVDREAGVIRGFRVMEAGPIRTHGIEADLTTLERIVELGNAAKEGVKSNFNHHDLPGFGGLGSFLGRASNFRLSDDESMVVADLSLAEVASNALGKDLSGYVLSLAEEDPGAFGASIAVRYEVEFRLTKEGTLEKDEDGYELDPLMRPVELFSVDLVGEPSATTALLSTLPEEDRTCVEAVLGADTQARQRALAALRRKEDLVSENPKPAEPAVYSKEQVDEMLAKRDERYQAQVTAALKADRERASTIRRNAAKLGVSAEKAEELIASDATVESALLSLVEAHAEKRSGELAKLTKTDPGASLGVGDGQEKAGAAKSSDDLEAKVGRLSEAEIKQEWEKSLAVRQEWSNRFEDFEAWMSSPPIHN